MMMGPGAKWRGLWAAVVGGVFCAGCVANGQPADGAGGGAGGGPDVPGPRIAITSGSGFGGRRDLTLLPGDRAELFRFGPGGRDPERRALALPPGTYDRALALVRREGPRALAAQKPARKICMDYGRDAVTVTPAENVFAGIEATCPDPAVRGLMAALRALVPGE